MAHNSKIPVIKSINLFYNTCVVNALSVTSHYSLKNLYFIKRTMYNVVYKYHLTVWVTHISCNLLYTDYDYCRPDSCPKQLDKCSAKDILFFIIYTHRSVIYIVFIGVLEKFYLNFIHCGDRDMYLYANVNIRPTCSTQDFY